jgi:hypothetical protein
MALGNVGHASISRAKSGHFSISRAKVWAKGIAGHAITSDPGKVLGETAKGFESPWGYPRRLASDRRPLSYLETPQ